MSYINVRKTTFLTNMPATKVSLYTSNGQSSADLTVCKGAAFSFYCKRTTVVYTEQGTPLFSSAPSGEKLFFPPLIFIIYVFL